MMLPHQKKTWRLAGLADLADDGPLSRAATRQIAVPNSQLAPAHPGLASQSACNTYFLFHVTKTCEYKSTESSF